MPRQVPSGTRDLSIEVECGDRTRRAVACVPEAAAPAGGWRLVVAFHGGRSQPEGMRRFSGLDDFAAAGEAVVVYPAGSGSRESMLTWNGGNCCGEAMEEGVDDVAFTRRLLVRMAEILPIDPRRIHATGMSNGAMMAYRLAVEAPDVVASIAPVAGPLALRHPGAGRRAVPVIHFHGTLDQFTPYEGGVGRRSVTRTHHRGVVDGLLEFVRAAGLDPEPARREEPSGDDGLAIERLSWGDPADPPFVLYAIHGAGHTWPGRRPDSFYLGSSALGFPANPRILDFFHRHPLR